MEPTSSSGIKLKVATSGSKPVLVEASESGKPIPFSQSQQKVSASQSTSAAPSRQQQQQSSRDSQLPLTRYQQYEQRSQESSFPHKEGVKKFLKHVALAAKKREMAVNARTDLNRHILSMKNMAATGVEKEAIENALEKLNEKLNKVLDKEGKIMVHDVKESVVSQELKLRIMELENRLNQIGQYDIDIIDALRNNIGVLKNQLYESESINRQRMGYLNNIMNDVRYKLDSYIRVKEERDKRVQEIEDKIKRQASQNFEEIQNLELQLAVFEEKFNKVNKLGEYADDTLAKTIKSRIDAIKSKILNKRSGMTPDQESFLRKSSASGQPSRFSSSSSGLNLGLPGLQQAQDNRHDMDFSLLNKQPSKPGELPPLPPLPSMPQSVKKKD